MLEEFVGCKNGGIYFDRNWEANRDHADPDTWSLPSESGVKHGVATPTLIGLEDATPKEIQLDRAGIETEIEAELLRGVGLSIALSGFGV